MSKNHLAEYPDIRTVQKEPELLWLIDELLANKVRTLLSIGLLDGGTEWHIARLYREKGYPIDITGIDVVSRPLLKQHGSEIVTDFQQSFKFLHGSSSSPEIISQLGKYDAVWIDGDHSYQGAKSDFELALTVTDTMIAFHDIIDSEYHRKKRCFVSRLWAEIKSSGYRTAEMAGDDWAGIGIMYLR